MLPPLVLLKNIEEYYRDTSEKARKKGIEPDFRARKQVNLGIL